MNIQLRYSNESNEWSDWQQLPREEHDAQMGKVAYALQILPEDAKQIQIVVELTSADIVLKNLRIAFISPGESSPELRHRKETVHKKRIAFDIPPEFISRVSWGCPEGQSSPRWNPLQTNVTHLIVHHTATSNSATDWAAVVRSIWVYHANTLDWGDIGYNWLVDPDGFIYQGRAWLDDSIADVRGGHFCGVTDDPNGVNNNEQTMGIGILGTFSSIPPTSNAIARLESILAWKASERSIDPNAISYHAPTELTIHNITGHRDGCATECPGESLYTMLPEIRNDVDSLLYEPVITLTGALNAGWNIVSLPVEEELRTDEVFPPGSSRLFEFACANGYESRDTMIAGRGFWVKLPSASPINVTGKARTLDTIEVGCSWNLIGTLSQSIAVSSIQSIPEGIVSSLYFSFDNPGGYSVSDTLYSFRGYWVKVSEPGRIILRITPLPSVR
ncbi:MAG: N-acetylmuramoyl-L-alanine amidase [Bacteroidetes bacterium]|nr:MAG: N-acetylmuramoyl-L-alanine amidase [Bacteroidota bacterium]